MKTNTQKMCTAATLLAEAALAIRQGLDLLKLATAEAKDVSLVSTIEVGLKEKKEQTLEEVIKTLSKTPIILQATLLILGEYGQAFIEFGRKVNEREALEASLFGGASTYGDVPNSPTG
jgi:hypothetical protein